MTNTTKAVETVIKTDALGRMKTSAARRETLLDEFDRSGLSGAKFAALVGLKYQTFAAWAHRRRQQREVGGAGKVPAKPTDSVRWLEAVVEEAQNPGGQNQSGLVLQLPGGAHLEINEVKQVALAAAFVRALAKAC
jgi:hypothetical protein